MHTLQPYLHVLSAPYPLSTNPTPITGPSAIPNVDLSSEQPNDNSNIDVQLVFNTITAAAIS